MSEKEERDREEEERRKVAGDRGRRRKKNENTPALQSSRRGLLSPLFVACDQRHDKLAYLHIAYLQRTYDEMISWHS